MCNGTRPSRLDSERAISFPSSLPLTITFTPCAPACIEVAILRRIACLKLVRRSILVATSSARSWASSSGTFISRTSILTVRPMSFSSSACNFSVSTPRRPITMPGRAVCILTVHFSATRSISIFEMPARSIFSLMYRCI